jgi:hypothetical protein
MGQMVEKTADGKGGRQTPARITPDPFEAGRVEDRSADPEGGSTGGGKLSGSGPEGLRGPAPPEVHAEMDRLADLQAEILQEGEKLKISLRKRGYYPLDLEKALEGMAWMEEALRRYAMADYAETQRNILGRLERLKTVAEASLRLDRERSGPLPDRYRRRMQSAFDEPMPGEFESLISRYYRSLAEDGEE